VRLVGDELFEPFGGQGLAVGEGALGDGIDGVTQPVGGGGVGAVHAGEDGGQRVGAEAHQLLPRRARLGVAGPLAADRPDARQQRRRVGGPGRCRQRQAQDEQAGRLHRLAHRARPPACRGAIRIP
jgi:hypothetical protein